MDQDDLHYERFKTEQADRHDAATLDARYAAWKKTRGGDMGSSETAADKAPRYEGFLASFGRAIGETLTVPSGPDSTDTSPTETRDTPRP